MSNANSLIEALKEKMSCTSDASLCRRLDLTPPVISKMRHGTLPVGDSFLINAHEKSGIPIAMLKELAGLPPGLRSLVHTVEV